MIDTDIELTRSEAELAREETTLQTEVDRLEVSRREAADRLVALRRRVGEAKARGAADAELEKRLEALSLGAPDAEACRALAREKRREAVAARQRANGELRTLLSGWRQELSTFGRQLTTDERAAEQLASQAAQRAVARDAERKATARRETDERASAMTVTSPSASKAASEPERKGRAARVDRRVPMQAVIDLSSDHNFFSGFSANLSDGGVFVATVNLFPLGTEVDLSFTLPTGEAIRAHGQVRWVREINDGDPEQIPGMGVHFLDLPKEAEAAIHRFVQEREPMFFAAA